MSMDVLIGRIVYLCQFKGMQMVYTYRRGLLRCSFNLRWAMREPQSVGRVTVRLPRSFHIYNYLNLFNNVLGELNA